MAEAAAPLRRRRRRPRPPPNPLFMRWLREWRDEAAGTPAAAAYQRALGSLSRFPLPLRSGDAAAILRHFGPRLCRRLQQRLEQHQREHGLPPAPPMEGRVPPLAPPTLRPQRPYKPRPRSASHALLLALLQSAEPLAEAELVRRAQPLSDWPLAPAKATPLLRRDLLQRSGRPPRYSLTPRGQILAQRLADEITEAPPPPEGPRPPGDTPAPELEFELRPGGFDIVLCADITEALGSGPRRGGVVALLQPIVLRRLPVGDFLWLAREKDPPPGRPPRELVLDVVVERKTGADLGRSLVDGRYREQKFRLGRCGLRHPLYLLEGPPLPPTLRQAAVSTQVVSGFGVHRTGGPRGSAAFLGALGEELRRRYEGRVLRSWGGPVTGRGPPEPPGTPLTLLPFPRLCEGGGKNQAQSVGSVFARQLLQVGGLSGGRAAAVLQRFPTPASLMDALGGSRDPQKLLEDTECGPLRRKLGPSLSRTLARLYGTAGGLE